MRKKKCIVGKSKVEFYKSILILYKKMQFSNYKAKEN